MKTRFYSLLSALLLCCTMIAVSGCGNVANKKAQMSIEKGMRSLNENCPVSYGDIGELRNVDYSDNCITLRLAINDNLIKLDVLSKHKDLMKTAMLASLSEVANDIKDAGAKIKVEYTGKFTNKKLVLDISNEEFVKACNDGSLQQSPENQLKMQMDLGKLQLPIKITDGMVISDMLVDSKDIVYSYSIDENLFDFNVVSKNVKAGGKDNIINEMTNNGSNAAYVALIKLCTQCNKGMRYKYVGTPSGRCVEVCISSDEVKKVARSMGWVE